jgi:nucleoid DNA-binding protein
MTYRELVLKVAEETGLSAKWTRTLLDEFIAQVKLSDDLHIKGFGRFFHVITKDRMGRNPKTGETQMIHSRRVLKFKGSKGA